MTWIWLQKHLCETGHTSVNAENFNGKITFIAFDVVLRHLDQTPKTLDKTTWVYTKINLEQNNSGLDVQWNSTFHKCLWKKLCSWKNFIDNYLLYIWCWVCNGGVCPCTQTYEYPIWTVSQTIYLQYQMDQTSSLANIPVQTTPPGTPVTWTR